jgi:hypothetical protein
MPAAFVPPMTELFRACNQVLSEALMPLHYERLTELAVERLGYQGVNIAMAMEDVREKMLERKAQAEKYEVVYTGRPACLVVKRRWFLASLLHADSVVIPGDAYCGYLAAYEVALRAPHMAQKHARATLQNIAEGRGRGLTIETHVAEWFRARWPEFYREPDNYGQHRRACGHDFKLFVDGHAMEVDVAGPDRHGGFGGVNKPRAHVHLLCLIDRPNVVWRAVQIGTLEDRVVPEAAVSPEKMVVWLNCRQQDIDYEALRVAVLYGSRQVN